MTLLWKRHFRPRCPPFESAWGNVPVIFLLSDVPNSRRHHLEILEARNEFREKEVFLCR